MNFYDMSPKHIIIFIVSSKAPIRCDRYFRESNALCKRIFSDGLGILVFLIVC